MLLSACGYSASENVAENRVDSNRNTDTKRGKDMGKRCQVCDGPIVDGRCKYCGMPYRNDSAMYHLNEDRSEHYRHASAKVRKAMAESEIPLPDRKMAEIKSANVSGRRKTQKQIAKTSQTMKQQTAGSQTTEKKKAGRYGSGKVLTSNTKPKRKRKNKKMAIFWAALLGLVILGESVPDYPERIADAVETFINEKSGTETENPLSDDSTLLADQDELENYYSFYIDTDSEACVIGESELFFEDSSSDDIKNESTETGNTNTSIDSADLDVADSDENSILCAGEYVIESGWEDVALEIREPSGEVQTIKFDEAKQQKKVELHNGYELTAVSLDEQYNYIMFYKIQQYDE